MTVQLFEWLCRKFEANKFCPYFQVNGLCMSALSEKWTKLAFRLDWGFKPIKNLFHSPDFPPQTALPQNKEEATF